MDQPNTASLTPHWLVCTGMLAALLTYNAICHFWGEQIRLNLAEEDRILIRTILYVVTIALFPLTNLIRHVMLRLNQTMPGDKSAAGRYLSTIITTQGMIEIVSLFGLIMFMLGDDFNTLYIFSLLGALGIFLHRPKPEELQSIVYALNAKQD